jgi:type III restriction enzyme
LFTWTVFDYPLKQAIIDNNVVKRPLKGIARGITEQRSDIAHVRYQAYLTAGVERWREYRKLLEPLSRKPVLFVMMNDTAAADDVGDWLRRKYPEDFAGDRLLVIHTDKTGEVTKKELDKARKTAREIDLESSPVNCIVSVLMLREGWDVRSVTVIVGLRPYTSKANILPEQTVGRGLRLMFPGAGGGYVERVDIIGNDAFIDFVGQLERDENLHLDTFDLEKDRVVIVTIQPEPAKADRDIAIPVLSPLLARKKSLAGEIAALDVSSLPCPVLPVGSSDRTADQFRYEGYDLVSLQKLIERDYRIPEPQTAEEIIGYYAQRIAQDLKLPSQFAALVPKVREFLETRAFGRPVDLRQPAMVRAIGTQVAAYVTVTAFAAALKTAVVTETEPRLVEAARPLSATPPFPWSRPTASARKTVFNLVPCDNEYEKAFAGFLERADDVERFGKLPPAFGFAIEYTDGSGNLRYYEPDFVAIDAAGVHWLLETKGLEDVDVAARDRAAALWCENASRLAGRVWRYRKVRQAEFEALRPERLADLGAGLLGPP